MGSKSSRQEQEQQEQAQDLTPEQAFLGTLTTPRGIRGAAVAVWQAQQWRAEQARQEQARLAKIAQEQAQAQRQAEQDNPEQAQEPEPESSEPVSAIDAVALTLTPFAAILFYAGVSEQARIAAGSNVPWSRCSDLFLPEHTPKQRQDTVRKAAAALNKLGLTVRLNTKNIDKPTGAAPDAFDVLTPGQAYTFGRCKQAPTPV